MKIFFSFIASIAVVFFGFLYYLDHGAPALDLSQFSVSAAEKAVKYQASTTAVSAKSEEPLTDVIVSPRDRFALNLERPFRPVGPDTLEQITGAQFWTQIAIRFDDDSTLIVNTRRFEQNEICLLENKSVRSRTNMRMFFVLDSLRGRQVWREVYRDNAVRSDIPLGEIELMRYKFLLKRSPPVF